MKKSDEILREVRELRGEVAVLRNELANRRCRGGTPAPAHPSVPYCPPIRPWERPYWDWPRITWYCGDTTPKHPTGGLAASASEQAPKL